MTTPDSGQSTRVLATLAPLVDSADRKQLAELAERVQSRRLRILVVGEAKRGKSTLVNHLVGTDVLPTGVVPVTAIATVIRRDRDCAVDSGRVIVTFVDGRHAGRFSRAGH